MLQLTKRTEYGLIALVHMVDRGGEYVSAREISEHYRIPRRLLAEVLKDLSRTPLVDSQRGAAGGYALARPAESIALGEVVRLLEGAPTLASCEGLGAADRRGECGVQPLCPIRSPLHRLREGIWRQMEGTSLRSLAEPDLAGRFAGSSAGKRTSNSETPRAPRSAAEASATRTPAVPTPAVHSPAASIHPPR